MVCNIQFTYLSLITLSEMSGLFLYMSYVNAVANDNHPKYGIII